MLGSMVALVLDCISANSWYVFDLVLKSRIPCFLSTTHSYTIAELNPTAPLTGTYMVVISEG